jgi:RND family efflux transporter MFP subunit
MRIFSFIIGLGLYLGLVACSPQAETAVQETVSPVSVRIMHIERQEFPLVVESVGRLIPNREVTLAAEVSGVVESFHTDVGKPVKKGQLLLKIDSTDYRLALMEAEAGLAIAESRLNLAKKVYERSKTLLPRKVITPDDFDKSEAEYLAAGASMKRATVLVDIARERFDKTKIRSPFDALTAERMIEVGQMIGAGQPVLTVVDLMPVRVKIYLSEKDYVQLDRDDPVSIMVEAFPEADVTGRIDRIDIKADERTNTFGVEILLDNPDFLLKAGMTARVRITVDTVNDAILIPQSTVQYKRDRQEVFVVGTEQRAEPRQVKLGRAKDDTIHVLDGLVPGDQLVVSGGQYLKSGDEVLITAFGRAGMK